MVELHVSVVVPPEVTEVGLAPSVTVGAEGGGVDAGGVEELPEFPPPQAASNRLAKIAAVAAVMCNFFMAPFNLQ